MKQRTFTFIVIFTIIMLSLATTSLASSPTVFSLTCGIVLTIFGLLGFAMSISDNESRQDRELAQRVKYYSRQGVTDDEILAGFDPRWFIGKTKKEQAEIYGAWLRRNHNRSLEDITKKLFDKLKVKL